MTTGPGHEPATATAVAPTPVPEPTDRGVVVDARPRLRRLAAPLLTLGVVAAATAYVGVVDPNQPGHYPLCPLRAMFGVDCPGCGGLRATHALAHGDLAAAADHNLMLVLLVPFAAAAWLLWMRRSWRGESRVATEREQRIRGRFVIALIAVMLVFGVVRNFVPYLGSTT